MSMNTPDRKLPPPMPEDISGPKPPRDVTGDFDKMSTFEFSDYLARLNKNERVSIKIPLRSVPNTMDIKQWLIAFNDRLIEVKIIATQEQHDQRPDLFELPGVTWQKAG
ncbi:MAG: hypothetical protein UT98_C0004G0038 [Candidatus Nomurabacteria bacterium GW2011_GWF2_40_31]|uniref:Uncharacterized protein n=2 Tax=Candidatus Nomuraibacteriota TaxID=1752729 RepID=A0A837HQH3_9BACT|nr:MAG: hypothetical protein UT27_C0006G0012 [Candidatus Nomurabacteria bacterium GW2011_GWD2_39_12]KKR59057.1 MAG: hypothetical protein UT98_C0004G0038 [Candidatus Nomurabacteria bacterium GW2011_GWF2_40_31]KKR83978.1 MAG: hypothetical protein UU30_C0008G0038 [Candidatus Nomurabacteria bacterium GW2011_GWA2_40_97]